ncbi:MAG: FAD-binding oxidoreductase [Candidatus Nanopelagicales bacterium]
MDSAPRTDPLLDVLRDVVGAEHVLTDPELVAPYTVDWSRRFAGPARAVVRPADTEQVAAVVRACVAAGAPVLPQGGNTGLVGGGVPASAPGPAGPPVVLSTRRLTRLDPVDDLSGQVTAGAGVTLGDLRRHVAAAGWEYGVDFAARDSATVGGTVATNAGGIRVVAFGMTRAQVAGVEAVLPDGTVVSHLGGLLKDNTGYDLGALLTGSEGTLGVITAVRLRLHRPVGATTVVLVGVDSYDEAMAAVRTYVAPGTRLLAAELVDDVGMDLVMAVAGLPWPLERPHPLVLLLEVEDGGTGDGLVVPDDADVAAALDAGDQERLWQYRERQSEAFSSLGVIHKLDVSVPLPALARCAAELKQAVAALDSVDRVGVFGHLADGNIHVEISGPDADDLEADALVVETIARHGGSVSAEHGIGRAKAHWLPLSRSAAEIATMRRLKRALDPDGLLNPGVLLDDPTG